MISSIDSSKLPSPSGEKAIHHEQDQALSSGRTLVRVDPRYFRPTEVDTLLGDPSKAKRELGWEPKIKFKDLVKEMVLHDLAEAQRDDLCRRAGYATCNHLE